MKTFNIILLAAGATKTYQAEAEPEVQISPDGRILKVTLRPKKDVGRIMEVVTIYPGNGSIIVEELTTKTAE